MLERDDAPARSRHRFLECSARDLAIGGIGDERREGVLALRRRVADDALDIRPRHEAQEIDAARSDARIRGKGDHRPSGRARDGRGSLDIGRDQGADNELGAFIDRFLGGRRGAIGSALCHP